MSGRTQPLAFYDHHAGFRIALYSHDTCGLGHLRRNLVIAHTLRSRLSADLLLISGIREAGAFPIGSGIDTLLLPALSKVDNLDYQPRRLGVGLDDLVGIRSSTVRAALTAFRPDVFIVDNVPRGAVCELDDTLMRLRATGTTYCVLGLRDVLDAPTTVKREWLRTENVSAIEDLYDAVWVYGDPLVYDSISEYGFPDSIRRKTVFTGYIDPVSDQDLVPERQVRGRERPDICVVGGGHDGVELAAAFAEACRIAGRTGIVLTGPFMSDDDTRRLASAPSISVRRFTANPIPLYRSARKIVAMGGYNTVLELLSIGVRPLIVPRVEPRCEQLMRAEAFEERGLVDLLHPTDLSPESVAEWLSAEVPLPTVPVATIDMTGLETIVSELARVMAAAPLALAG